MAERNWWVLDIIISSASSNETNVKLIQLRSLYGSSTHPLAAPETYWSGLNCLIRNSIQYHLCLSKIQKNKKTKKQKNPKRLILLTIFSMVSVQATLNNKINYHFFTNNKSLMNINENDISAIFRYLHENNSHERDNLSIRKSNHLKSLLPILDKNIWRDQYIKIYSITFPISFNRRSQRKV